MSNPIEQLCDKIMSASATISGDSDRATAPYYRYGSRWFNTQEEYPPQVRVKRTFFSVGKSMQKGGIDFNNVSGSGNLSGSIGTIEQQLQFKIWGLTEEQCLQEFNFLCQAINHIKTNNPQGISQPGIVDNITNCEWVDIDNHSDLGEMLTFNYFVNVVIPERQTDIAFVSSSLQFISQSISGSYDTDDMEGSKAITLTTASYS